MIAMTSRERVRRAIAHEEPDRVPVYDSPWTATVERWRREGLPPDVLVQDFFDYDLRRFCADTSPRFPVKVIAENDEYITETTSWGGVRRNHKDRTSTPEVIECPVKKGEDWPALKRRLQPSEDRVDWAEARASYRRAREAGRYVVFASAAGYDQAQSVMRSEYLLLTMASDPELVREIIMTIARMVCGMYEIMLARGFEFDGVWTSNDMGYRNASLFSPQMYREIVWPGDKLVWETAHRHGAQTIMHSCGRVSALIPDMIEGGLDCLQSLEVKAGMDLIALNQAYGDRLAFFGGIDTRLLEDPDPALIEEEVRTKFAACMPGGGYLYHTDHSVPHDVSFAQYRHLMEVVRRCGAY